MLVPFVCIGEVDVHFSAWMGPLSVVSITPLWGENFVSLSLYFFWLFYKACVELESSH